MLHRVLCKITEKLHVSDVSAQIQTDKKKLISDAVCARVHASGLTIRCKDINN